MKHLKIYEKGHPYSKFNRTVGYWKLVTGKMLLTLILFDMFLS